MFFDFSNLSFIEDDRSPDRLAISGSDKDISWNEFRKLTNDLLKLFLENKIPKGHPIIIYGHKEYLFPVAITACMMYGTPYIPVDTMFPPSRVKKIIDTSGSQVIIHCGNDTNDLDVSIAISSDLKVKKRGDVKFEKIIANGNDPVVYIMFTSGSTGDPKGVMITLSAVRSFAKWVKEDYGYQKDSVFMNQASFSFDISLIDLYGTLIFGGKCILNDSKVTKDPANFISRIRKYGCTDWVSTPSFIYMYFTDENFNTTYLPALRKFILLGEDLPSRIASQVFKNFPSAQLMNGYGPTEATVAATLAIITPEINTKYAQSLPIGISQLQGEVLIKNETNDTSQEGEICIVGDHVSIGYLNNPTLTKEKFYQQNNKRAYATGDYGYIKDGLIFFNGRKDDQIKLHGNRIELGDINSRICNLEFINDAVTVPLKRGNAVKKIVSFVQLKKDSKQESAIETIKTYLEKNLPPYMIPGDIRIVAEFPHNNNHKIDRNKLIEDYINS